MSNYVETTSEEALDNSFWSIVREAFAGSQRDFTKGSIGLAIFLLAVPMILEMFMESIFALVDIYFVGHLGADSVAIVGLTESIMALIYAVAIGLSVGATATVARRYGEKDVAGAAKSAAHAIMLGVIVSIVLSILGLIFAPQILSLLGAEPQIIAEGTTFMRIMLGGNAVVVFLFLLNAIFRGAGDAAIAMKVLFVANLLNIILAPCFIMGADIFAFLGINAPQAVLDNWIFPKLGVTGAAIGTTIGRGAGVLFAAFWLFRPGGRITIHKNDWKIDTELLISLLKIAAPAVLQFTVATASWSALVRVVAGFGSEAIAGYVIGLRVIVFALLPAVGLSNAAATLVGQNLGADKPERAEKSVWKAAFINAGFLGMVGIIFLLFSNPIVSFFTDEAAVLAYGTNCLHIVAYGFIFYAFGMVLESAFNGAGDTWTPTYINLFIFWIFEIPLAFILAYGFSWVGKINDYLPFEISFLNEIAKIQFNLGPDGVFWAITISFSLLSVVSAAIFRRGKWKLKQV